MQKIVNTCLRQSVTSNASNIEGKFTAVTNIDIQFSLDMARMNYETVWHVTVPVLVVLSSHNLICLLFMLSFYGTD